MARTLSAIPQVRRRDISTTARPGVDKLGPSGNAREWRDASYARQRAPKTTRSSKQGPPSQEDFFRSISIDRGCPRPPRRSNSGMDRHHRGCVQDQKAITKKDKFYLLTKVKSSNHEKRSSSDPPTNKLQATSKSGLKLSTMIADCGFCGRDKR